MSQEELFHSCVGKLYEMALEPQGWEGFLDDFCTLVDASFAHYLAWEKKTDIAVFSAASSTTPTCGERAYIEHYGALDPQRKLITERADGRWVLCHEVFDDRYVSRSEFYQDFLIPVGGRYVAIADVGQVDGVMLGLGMHRSKDRSPFGPRELMWLERIKPHMQRAARLHMEVWQLRLHAKLAEHALDALQYPVMVVDDRARVLLANASADRWLSENGGVCLRSGRLGASHVGLEQRLSRAITAATRGESAVRTGGVLAVPRKASPQNGASKPFSVRVMPLQAGANLAVNWQRPLALLVVADPEAPAPLEPLALQTLFGLTPAEARLAVSLADGKTLEEVAQNAHVSLNTAKTQLRIAFEKTGTHRQAELVKLVLSQPRIAER